MEKKNRRNKKKTGLYIIGSVALAAGAFIAMPKIIDSLSTKMYRVIQTPKDEDDDDWGPEILRKEKDKEDKPDGDI